jgi:hypothetical protein
MDHCLSHVSGDVIGLLTEARVYVIILHYLVDIRASDIKLEEKDVPKRERYSEAVS